MKKRLLTIFLTVAALMALLVFTASAETVVASGNCGSEGDGSGLKWSLTSDGTLTFTGSGTFWDYTDPDLPGYQGGAYPWDAYAASILSIVYGDGIFPLAGYEGDYPNLESISVSGLDNHFTQDGVLYRKYEEEVTLICYPPAKKDTTYTLPGDVTDVYGLNNRYLTTINVDAANPYFFSVDGVLFGSPEYYPANKVYLVAYPAGKTNTSYVVPDYVDALYVDAFVGCVNLNFLTIPANVTELETESLAGLEANTAIYFIGDAPDMIGEIAAFGDSSLANASSCTVYYPAGNSTYTQDYLEMYSEYNNITWKTYDPNSILADVVDPSLYYYTPVNWAAEKNITTGTAPGTFSPVQACKRAQVVTFLWRAAGCPEPTNTVSPFVDVQDSSAYYYKAVLWAVEKGITTGMDDTHFNPEESCNRAQIVTFLWRYENKPSATGSNPFVDVNTGAYYYDAVLWAAENKITTGIDETHFSPDEPCLRCQVVTFLYRDFAK